MGFIESSEELMKHIAKMDQDNSVFQQTYTEEVGPYQGLSRIVIRNFACSQQHCHFSNIISRRKLNCFSPKPD